MVNILITDSVFPKNAGDSAILIGMLEDLKKSFPHADITILSKYHEAAKERLSYPFLPNLFDSVRGWGGKGYPFDLPAILKAICRLTRNGVEHCGLDESVLEAYGEADLVISCGGGFINDYYNVYKVLAGYYVAHLFGKPTAIYAQSIGPLNLPVRRMLARAILDEFTVIATRDARSKIILEKIGVRKPEIVVAADASLNLPPADGKRATELLETLGLDPRKNYIAFSVRKWIYPSSPRPEKPFRNYVEELAKTADYLVDAHGVEVVFISTCNEEDYAFNDPQVAAQIIARMRHAEKATNVRGVYDPRDIKAIMGVMYVGICTRMHPLIFCTSMGVPAVGVEYEFKTREYLQALGLEEYCVRIEDITHEKLIMLIEDLIRKRARIAGQLKEKVKTLQRRSREVARILATKVGQ
jgi:polysaccharide pyruvyl transferase WcaK-like protein